LTARAACRIGRVKFKNGVEIRILEGPRGGHPDVIAMLLDALADARAGNVTAAGIVFVSPTGGVSTAWETGDSRHYHHLVSGAARLLQRLGDQR
jgi:hypothetical protein